MAGKPLGDTRLVLAYEDDAISELKQACGIKACIQIEVPMARNLVHQKDRLFQVDVLPLELFHGAGFHKAKSISKKQGISAQYPGGFDTLK